LMPPLCPLGSIYAMSRNWSAAKDLTAVWRYESKSSRVRGPRWASHERVRLRLSHYRTERRRTARSRCLCFSLFSADHYGYPPQWLARTTWLWCRGPVYTLERDALLSADASSVEALASWLLATSN
jgi:hypothetical protein